MNGKRKITRQGQIIDKIASKGKTIKFNPKRLSVYHNKRYAGWVSRKEYGSLRRESRASIRPSKYKGRQSIRFDSVVFEKPVMVKTGKGKPKRHTWRILTYTRSQRSFVAKLFRRGKIPVRQSQPFQRLTRIKKGLKLLNIKSSAFSVRRKS